MFDLIKSVFYEISSYFVPEKLTYEITGECKKCGKCCNYMYSKDTYTEKEFKIMQMIFPKYKRVCSKKSTSTKYKFNKTWTCKSL